MGLHHIILAITTLSAQEIRLAPIATSVDAPTDIQHAPGQPGVLYLVQQNGLIRILRNGAIDPAPFLDIRSKTRADGERGLLGLAFPPSFPQSGRFYVNYTNLTGATIIAMYSAGSPTETILLQIPQPFANHNGGQLRFGPDGYLYIGMGDGGSAGDPQSNGQNRNALLGKMLRVDVESEPGRVLVPPTNPFPNTNGTRPEVWALGLRNPWRFSFDRATGDLWIADVGQNAYEEINFQPASSKGGENYGWNLMEGAHCFRTATCNTQGLTLPVAEYGRNDGCSITGGFVYRGRSAPGLRGSYIYADYCSGRIWGLERSGTQWVNRLLLLAAGRNITTFGEDETGELYVGDASSDTIFRIEGSLAPRFSAPNVVNSASYAPGIVPGALATIFASGVLNDEAVISAPSLPLPTDLRNVSLTVNGTPAGILALANQRGVELVNFQVPPQTTGPNADIVLTREGNRSSPVTVPILARQPAIFTTNGTDAIVVQLPEYALVTTSQPLRRGDFAYLYANALGTTENTETQITLGGVACPVQFAGPPPGLIAVYQVNFQVPQNTPSGTQELILRIANTASPAVKIPVSEPRP
ncbi:MAG: PQQ-dependent sugar dehydrogenase [Acidobacteria bacterium]|nr:PQQ-dependent sugar dehydrogenase [Acidobacteriota bacterium]